MVALTGRWWLEVRKPRKEVVAAHLVNLAWNGLSHLEAKPTLVTRQVVAQAGRAARRRRRLARAFASRGDAGAVAGSAPRPGASEALPTWS